MAKGDPDISILLSIMADLYADLGVTVEAITGRDNRLEEIVEIRHILIVLLHEAGWGAMAIARVLHRDHSTVIHHQGLPLSWEEKEARTQLLERLARHLHGPGSPAFPALPPSLRPPLKGLALLEEEALQRAQSFREQRDHRKRMRLRAVRLTERDYPPLDQKPCLVCGDPVLRKDAPFGFQKKPSDECPAPRRTYHFIHPGCRKTYMDTHRPVESKEHHTERTALYRHKKGALPLAVLRALPEKRCWGPCGKVLPLADNFRPKRVWKTHKDGTRYLWEGYDSFCLPCRRAYGVKRWAMRKGKATPASPLPNSDREAADRRSTHG